MTWAKTWSVGRRVTLVVSAVAAVFLSADRVTGLFFATADDTHFEASRGGSASSLVLDKDTKQDSVLIYLALRTPPNWKGRFRAALEVGDSLAVDQTEIGPGSWRAYLSSPAQASRRRGKFLWPNGQRVRLWTVPEASLDSIVDWSLFFADRQRD